uniref:Reverse transcriptase zinc-binding domain-containing protein n=1 Tax=Lactuca sativa TaxID=4236 RepID=A0A9R1VDZ0_LACSA|nr:hypothetical protein LSAT_V11C500283590 [Lactuca sativa]
MLSARFLRLFTLASNGDAYIFEYWLGNACNSWMIMWRKSTIGGVLQHDCWRCVIETEDFFSVKAARYRFDLVTLVASGAATRLLLNRLPTCCNLDYRGIELPSHLCPCCEEVLELVVHLFLKCSLATKF